MSEQQGRDRLVPPPLSDLLRLVPDHAGIVVEELEAAVAGLAVLFGEPAERMHLPEVGLRGAVFSQAELPVEVLCFETGPWQTVTEGPDPRVFETVKGIQHLAYRVPDLHQALGLLEERGAQVLKGFPRRGVHGDILFFTLPGSEVLWELVERRAVP